MMDVNTLNLVMQLMDSGMTLEDVQTAMNKINKDRAAAARAREVDKARDEMVDSLLNYFILLGLLDENDDLDGITKYFIEDFKRLENLYINVTTTAIPLAKEANKVDPDAIIEKFLKSLE